MSSEDRSTGHRVLLVTENCRLQSIVSYQKKKKKVCFSHPYWQEASFKSSTDSRFIGYRVFPVTEEIAGDKLVGQEASSEKFFNQLVTEPTDRVLAYTTFIDGCFTREGETLVKLPD